MIFCGNRPHDTGAVHGAQLELNPENFFKIHEFQNFAIRLKKVKNITTNLC